MVRCCRARWAQEGAESESDDELEALRSAPSARARNTELAWYTKVWIRGSLADVGAPTGNSPAT
eukprot:4444386-Alexandrium_andersonii.AAC.1